MTWDDNAQQSNAFTVDWNGKVTAKSIQLDNNTKLEAIYDETTQTTSLNVTLDGTTVSFTASEL